MERMQMKIVMRYTREERLKWLRMMSRIRQLCREQGRKAEIMTRKLPDGSRVGEISW